MGVLWRLLQSNPAVLLKIARRHESQCATAMGLNCGRYDSLFSLSQHQTFFNITMAISLSAKRHVFVVGCLQL